MQTSADTYDPSTLSAPEILAKAREAAGRLDAGAYVAMRTIESSRGEQRVTTFIDGNNWRRNNENGGGISSAMGSYEGRSWIANANGIVRITSGFRQDDPNELAFRDPGQPENHVTVLGLTPTQPQEYVIDINPPDGADEHLYYNAKTFLLDKSVQFSRGGYQYVAEYSDYQRFYGRMQARRIHRSDGRPTNDTIETLVSFTPTQSVPDLRIPDSKPLFTLDGTTPVVIPAQFTGVGVVIQAKLGERGYDFILDSGASGLYLDRGVAHELGLTENSNSVRVPNMSIGPLQMHDVAFGLATFDYQGRDSRVVGLIGFDFLASAITELDFKAKTLTLYPRSAFAASMAGLRALPIQLDDGVPRTKVSVEDVPGSFLVDTGAFMTLAELHAFSRQVENAKP